LSAPAVPNPPVLSTSLHGTSDQSTNNTIVFTNNANINILSQVNTIENHFIRNNDNNNATIIDTANTSITCNQQPPSTHHNQNQLHKNPIFTDDHNNNPTDHTNNVIITENQFNIDIDINQLNFTHTNNSTNIQCRQTELTNIIPTSSTRHQYLISHFFKPINITSTQPHREINNINVQAITNAIPQNNNNNNHNYDYPIYDDTNTILTPTNINILYDTTMPRPKSKRKNYVQKYLLKKPIANEYWGASMDNTDPTCFRIYFQNINGLTAGKLIERWYDTCNTMKNKKCEIFGLAETNTNWKSHNITTKINLIINKHFTNLSTILSTNRYNPNNSDRFQPGSTLQSCTGHWKSRCIATIQDFRNMGRWVGQKFQLKNKKTLTVITAYRPCKQSNNIHKVTSSTTYRQQIIILTEDGVINPDPRKVFIEDMISLIQEYDTDANNYTILMFDSNENVNNSDGGINQLLQTTNLIDVFSYISNDECNVPTYVRGNKKIDYILTSESLLPFIKNLGCLPFYMYNNSDHRGLFVDISEHIIDTKVELKQPTKRHIGTNNSGYEIYTYKKYIDKQFKNHKIYNKKEDLKRISHNTTKREFENILNNLDTTITEIMLAAEKKLQTTT
jgi:hypothetical protein